MLIFDENTDPVIFENVLTPTNVQYFYTLDLEIFDVTLSPLYALEEIVCPAFEVHVGSFSFKLPTSYYILVFSEDTSQVDTIKVSELTSNNLDIFSGNDINHKILGAHMKIVDYLPEHTFVIPFLNKNQLLCHPIAPKTWINITPYDLYSKYLKTAVIGDFM